MNNRLLVTMLTLPCVIYSAHGQSIDPCSKSKKSEQFVLQRDARLDVSGESREGPICVTVAYNPLHFYIDFNTAVTYTAGPDLSTVFTGGSSNTADKPKPNSPYRRPAQLPTVIPPQSIPEAFFEIEASYQGLHRSLHALDEKYSQALNQVNQTVQDIGIAVQQVDSAAPPGRGAAIKGQYKSKVQKSLLDGLAVQGNYLPADRASNPTDLSLMDALNYAKDSIDFLPQQFPSGDSSAANPDFECTSAAAPTKKPGWALWYAKCKAAYDALETEVATDITAAQQYVTDSTKVNALKKNIAILKFWDARFASLSLTTELRPEQIDGINLEDALSKSKPEVCSFLFNRNRNSTIAISYSDLMPTLTGSAPSPGKTDPFITVTCSSPFSLSAGVEFSNIGSPEFAIIKSAGGMNNTSVNKFGVLSNSSIHPMPIAIANLRFAETADHRLAGHASFGVSGNFQSQNSGGSSADFLIGGSLSLWRTMFLTLGVQIGTKPSLAGGFHVGDTVPSDITAVQVSKSYTAGVGFAITFTKP